MAAAEFNPPTGELTEAHRGLIAHVHAAGHLAAAFGAGQGEDGFLYALNTELLSEWNLDAETLEAALPLVLERVSRLLGERVSTGRIVF